MHGHFLCFWSWRFSRQTCHHTRAAQRIFSSTGKQHPANSLVFVSPGCINTVITAFRNWCTIVVRCRGGAVHAVRRVGARPPVRARGRQILFVNDTRRVTRGQSGFQPYGVQLDTFHGFQTSAGMRGYTLMPLQGGRLGGGIARFHTIQSWFRHAPCRGKWSRYPGSHRVLVVFVWLLLTHPERCERAR
eukprot:scaffold24286_cov30-Tisochrysis_lutea.AAC.3